LAKENSLSSELEEGDLKLSKPFFNISNQSGHKYGKIWKKRALFDNNLLIYCY
jgi:hypothetical protein